MAKKQYINIAFPLAESNEGNFLKMTKTDSQAIKADIVHLLLTAKGERLYLPEFGLNLRKFIFEPQDAPTYEDIKREIKDTLKRYIPNLEVDSIDINDAEDRRYTANIRLDYTITEDVYEKKDFVDITL